MDHLPFSFFQFFHEIHIQEVHMKHSFAWLGIASDIRFLVDDESKMKVDDDSMIGQS